MTDNFASITETPGILLSPEQHARFLHRYAFGLQQSGLMERPVRMLEVGSGAGSGLAAWHSAAQMQGGLAVGLEYVESSLQLARSNLGDSLPLLAGDAQCLPFGENTFDAIASFEVIYYLPDLAAFLRESRRTLAPGGKLILCWSNPEWESFAPGKHSGHYPTLAEVVALLVEAGFTETYSYGAFPSTQASAKARWVNRARRLAVRTGLTSLLGALAAPLMRAVYGELVPLPVRLPLESVADHAAAVDPLSAQSNMRIHRVLYTVAA